MRKVGKKRRRKLSAATVSVVGVVVLTVVLMVASVQAAVEYDLTSSGAVQNINGAIFMQWTDTEPMGSGRINAFVGIRGSGFQHGYNTTGVREFDTTPDSKALLLSDIPIVEFGGTNYREFWLDINQNSTHHILSLDKLKIHMGTVSDLTGYLTNPAFGAPIYDLDAGGDNYVKLDYNLNPGSGKGDMLLFVPDSAFIGAGNYTYLYSMFGATINGVDGFEEWAVGIGPIIPEPATMALLALGTAMLLRIRKR
jgi:hypothetical protein